MQETDNIFQEASTLSQIIKPCFFRTVVKYMDLQQN